MSWVRGVLGRAEGETAETIPIAVADDAGQLPWILRFILGVDSKKRALAVATKAASLTVSQFASPGAWRRVVLAGRLAEIDSEDVAQAAALFSTIGEVAPLDIFARPLEEFDTAWDAVEIAEITGRAGFETTGCPRGRRRSRLVPRSRW